MMSTISMLDAWVEKSWAKGGYVPADVVTSDHESVFPGQNNQGAEPYAIQQVRSEISELIDVIKGRDNPRFVALEIGMGNTGGTHTLWGMIFDRVVTVELHQEIIDNFHLHDGYSNNSLFICGDSRDSVTRHRVHENIYECDLLFIDGDHTLEGVRADYENYKDLVRDGGLIVFHDTQVDGPPNIMVRSFIDELESSGLKLHHIRHSKCVGISYLIKGE